MKFVKNVKIDIPHINQEFELGDLTIFIGRSNSGKTRILKDIDSKIIRSNDTFKTKKGNHQLIM